MAIARDAVSNGVGSAITSLTVSHTSTGSNLVILSFVLTLPGTDIVTGVTHNAVAETRVNTINNTGGTNGAQRKYSYILVTPATGVRNVVASTSESATILLANVTYTGCKQTGQPDANNTAFYDLGTSTSVTVTTVANNSVVVTGYRRNNYVDTAGTGTTQVQSDAVDGGAIYESNPLAVTPAGAKTLTVNISGDGGDDQLYCAVSIAPFVSAAPTGKHTLLTMGVG